MKMYLALTLNMISFSTFAGQIALSFDDAPRKTTYYFKGQERASKLIKALKEAKVKQAIFFATTQELDSAEGIANLTAYANAGHIIGNHTHTHQRPDKIGFEKYIADIKIADSKLKHIKNFASIFRYPFLDYGKTITSRNRIRQELKTMGYINGYVTVDNADWYMDLALQKAIRAGKRVNHINLRKAYIDALWDSIVFYDSLAKKVIGRSPKHVLLLHENDLAALYTKHLVEHIRSKGWEIISPQEAYKDPIASIVPDTLKNNNGRIAAIAHAQGYEGAKRDFYQSNREIESLFAKRKVFEK